MSCPPSDIGVMLLRFLLHRCAVISLFLFKGGFLLLTPPQKKIVPLFFVFLCLGYIEKKLDTIHKNGKEQSLKAEKNKQIKERNSNATDACEAVLLGLSIFRSPPTVVYTL